AARASAEILLGYRSRSESEIMKRLEQKGYSPAAIEHALRYLKLQGYINDKEYASSFANAGAACGLGRRRLAAELRRRGVANELAEAALQSIDENTEKKLALEFARRRAASMVHLDPVVKARRLAAMLERRGFPYPAIRAALEHLVEQGEVES
ncbi:MAG TPA: regulatory protein RecX, partial [Armatimonadota bacterium]|nr:regulatory protein RecX [Armatimonadota bacterium]